MKSLSKYYVLFALIISFSAVNAQHGHGNMVPDKPSVHGMLIFGKEKIYASHLPLFHAPHNYQIILELELDSSGKHKFIEDQRAHPEQSTYSIEPERFVLPDMIKSKGSFKANLYRGHFERGGIKIDDSVRFKILSVIYFKKFDASIKKSADANFILFGNSNEQFLVHHITNKPDFEQIIQVKTEDEIPIRTERNAIVILNAIENSPVGISGNTIEIDYAGKKQKIVLLKQLYLEFDDLKQ